MTPLLRLLQENHQIMGPPPASPLHSQAIPPFLPFLPSFDNFFEQLQSLLAEGDALDMSMITRSSLVSAASIVLENLACVVNGLVFMDVCMCRLCDRLLVCHLCLFLFVLCIFVYMQALMFEFVQSITYVCLRRCVCVCICLSIGT